MKALKSNLRRALLAIAALSTAASAMSASAQGTVLFQNDGRGLVYKWAGLTNSTLVLVPWDNEPHIQIAYAPTDRSYTRWQPGWTTARWLSANPGWILGPAARMARLPSLGLFDGGTISLNGIAAGSGADYFIFAWGPGTNFDSCAAFGIWCGVAGPFTTLTGGGAQPPVCLAASFTGVTIVGSTDCSAPASESFSSRGRPGMPSPATASPSRSNPHATGPGTALISSVRPAAHGPGPAGPRPTAVAPSKRPSAGRNGKCRALP
jgi:hypothetical protein